MLARLFRRSQRGDTIVEVMICIAVIGLGIGTGYALTNRSFRYGLGSAERSQAQAIIQGQAEFIKDAYLTEGKDAILSRYKGVPNMCIYPGISAFPWQGSPTIGQPVTGPNCAAFDDTIYNVNVNYTASDSTFAIRATWGSGTGSGTNQTVIYYKVP